MNLFKKLIRNTTSPFCICSRCPSYPGKKDPKVYCEYGKSEYPTDKRGCICSKCIVWKINRFKNQYYCEVGKDPKSRI
ncbi:MAG TPA: DUF2769 domain-containing protein [Candidatus Nealsonbacteria bacterium]|nr:DUF2769 domain-containing protein [Candidatus Nealsonbacteria bacterium]HEB46794.1 DUF2769 domain-containing protein [Candidatus Nealsonbacteria bacterium]